MVKLELTIAKETQEPEFALVLWKDSEATKEEIELVNSISKKIAKMLKIPQMDSTAQKQTT